MEKKSAKEVLMEKYEERGWYDMYDWTTKTERDIDTLPFSEEEYREFSSLLAKMALQDQNSDLCEMYFEIQRRAVYGNGYYPLDINEEEEMQMWALGTGEVMENVGHGLH
ncbi:MAG: hypothetical protein K2I70_04015 [Bacilli bacterium]|nr:hypothetical protein [Bacilli bacterium]